MHDLLVLPCIANVLPGLTARLRGLRLLTMMWVYLLNVVTFGSVNELFSSTFVDINGCQSHFFKIMPFLDAM